MKPQRILLISKRFWPLSGETELLAAEFARQLAVMVERVEVVTWKMVRQWPDCFTLGDVDVHRLPQSQKSSWSAANLGQYGRSRWHRSLQRWLASQTRRFDAAIVFEHENETLTPTVAACRAGLPVVSRIPLSPSSELSRVALRDWKSLMQSSVVFVSPRSDLMLNPLCRPDGPLQTLRVVSDGVCSVGKINDPITARKILSQVHPIFQLKQGALLAVSGCDLTYDSGVFGLVRAWRRVVAKHKSARLWLIGTGHNAPELFQRICDLDLQHSVLLTGNFDDVEEVFSAADLYIQPGTNEPAGWYSSIAAQTGLTIIRHRKSDRYDELVGAGHSLVFDDETRTLDFVMSRWAESQPTEGRVPRRNSSAPDRGVRSVAEMARDYLELLQFEAVAQ